MKAIFKLVLLEMKHGENVGSCDLDETQQRGMNSTVPSVPGVPPWAVECIRLVKRWERFHCKCLALKEVCNTVAHRSETLARLAEKKSTWGPRD